MIMFTNAAVEFAFKLASVYLAFKLATVKLALVGREVCLY